MLLHPANALDLGAFPGVLAGSRDATNPTKDTLRAFLENFCLFREDDDANPFSLPRATTKSY